MPIDAVAIAEAALGRRVRTATVTTSVPISYDPYLAGRDVLRVTGHATLVNGESVSWAAMVKRTTGIGLRAARRELAAYRDGVAAPTPATGLRAPAMLGWDEGPDHVELWLEPLRDRYDGAWPTARFALAAEHIAAWDVQASRRSLPAGFDAEDAWAERHGQPERVNEARAHLDRLRATPGAAEVMTLLDDPGFRRTDELISSTPRRIERLSAFPRGPLHHDLVRSNLFAVGEASTAAIDWENVGRGPFGVNLAPLVVGSVRRGDASADDLDAIEAAVVSAYARVVSTAGVARTEDVELAYRLALGLRWHVVLGTIGTWLDPTVSRMRGSRPEEPRAEGLRHIVAVSRHLVAAGGVAMGTAA